jgi:hypothetical protein
MSVAMQVLDVTGFLKYAVQAAAMFETRFNSVERLMAYFDLQQEAPRHIEATKCAATRESQRTLQRTPDSCLMAP